MRELKIIEKDVSLFHTPYCDFSITDDENNVIRFDIMESPEKDTTVYIDNDENQIVPITCCAGKTMRIYTKSLKLKKNYYIHTSVKLEIRDSDERLYTAGITGDTFTFAASFPDPNEMVKFDPNYTEDNFEYYNIEPDQMSFILRLYDREKEYIDIFTFWIWNIQQHMDNYESACDVATWWCP